MLNIDTTLYNVICYRVIATGEEYLAYYTFKNAEDAQKEADQLNSEKPERLWNDQPAKCNERFYFVSQQEMMY